MKNDNFLRIMKTQSELALATSIHDSPNVRIVNFFYDAVTNTLYFTTFADNDKVLEFESNPTIAFTTIPHQGVEHIKAKGTVQKSSRSINDVGTYFIKKIPDYKDTLEQAGEFLVLYEIKFSKATVTLDFETIDIITFDH